MPASATARTFAAASLRPCRTAGSSSSSAWASSSGATAMRVLSEKRSSYSSNASSPRSRTSSTIAVTCTAPVSVTVPRTRAATAAASSMVQLSRTDALQQRVDRAGLELVGDRVGDQPGGRGRDLLADDQAVLAQRGAGGGEVDDPLDEAGQRRQLDRALDLDDLGLAARALEVAGGDLRVLGGDAHDAEAAQRLRGGIVAGDGGEDHPAGPEAEVEQLVALALGLLGEHVLAGDPDVGRSRLDVGRHVARAHRHDPGVLEQELAVVRA